MSQRPRLLHSPLTGRVYIVTRYRMNKNDRSKFEALEKFDVTDEFASLRSFIDAVALEGED